MKHASYVCLYMHGCKIEFAVKMNSLIYHNFMSVSPVDKKKIKQKNKKQVSLFCMLGPLLFKKQFNTLFN